MSVTGRCGWYISAQRRARRFGFPFVRRKSFVVPRHLVVNGARIAVETPQEHGSRVDFIAIFLNDCYHLERLKKLDGGIRCILDVGSNCGWFSIAARNHFPRATIHAYEPNPAVLPFLQHNTGQIDVVAHPEAVGAQDGMVNLLCDGESNQTRTIDGGDIRRVAFSAAIERLGAPVDLLKLDCEGAEWAVLERPEDWATVRWLTMEYHLWARPGLTHRDAAQCVARLGFEVLEQRPTGEYGLLLAHRRQSETSVGTHV